jgi:hypothetical protein
MMAAALTLQAEQDISGTFHLFDTFTGMPPPSEIDRAARSGRTAASLLARGQFVRSLGLCTDRFSPRQSGVYELPR